VGDSGAAGKVFRIDRDGIFTDIHTFHGADGAFPATALFLVADGTLYGTTRDGGDSDLGTLFSIDTAGVFTPLLHSFTGTDGANPRGALFQASDGLLYGTTSAAGAHGAGTIFRMDINGTVTVLHHFNDASDGAAPLAGLIQASDGALYGTTSVGGPGDGGTIFRLTGVAVPPANAVPTVSVSSASIDVAESQIATNTGPYADVDTLDNVTITASVGTLTKSGTSSGTWSWSFPTTDGPAQSQTVTITADDGRGGMATTTFSVSLNNVPPSMDQASLPGAPTSERRSRLREPSRTRGPTTRSRWTSTGATAHRIRRSA
jgi:uncharacterized repeat protein (TIGR03803 family)